jgi:predicted anti-sigma-YlaC factor YlaD
VFGRRVKPQRNEPPQSGAVIPCRLSREAISALIDGEDSPLPETVTTIHLARCRDCRDFRDDAVLLTRQIRARALAVVPQSPPELISRFERRDQAPRVRRLWAGLSRFSWSRATQWAVGAVPLGFALPALLLGAFAHTHIVPSHALSPCTMGLHHARWPWHRFDSGK